MRRHLIPALLAGGLGLAAIEPAAAQVAVGPAFTYQGQLMVGGQPASGSYDFIFELVNDASGGNLIGQQDVISGVPVADGLFTVALNENGEFGPDAFSGEARWIQVRVKAAGDFVYEPLAPRQPLAPAAYAHTALRVPGIDGHSLNSSDGSIIDALYVSQFGQVGIGTTSPIFPLDIRTAGDSYGLLHYDGVHGLATWTGAYGTANGSWIGTVTHSPLYFYTYDSGARMTVSVSGNVGIGATDPQARLHVADGPVWNQVLIESFDSEGTWLNLENTDTGGHRYNLISTGSTNIEGPGMFLLRDATQQTVRMAVGADGNVGIGTIAPASKLDVRGDIRVGPNGNDFAAAGEENLRLVRGRVGSGATLLAGAGFAVTRPSVGVYTITFARPFSASPSLTASADGNVGGYAAMVMSSGGASAQVTVFDSAGNRTNDVGFDLIAIGPR